MADASIPVQAWHLPFFCVREKEWRGKGKNYEIIRTVDLCWNVSELMEKAAGDTVMKLKKRMAFSIFLSVQILLCRGAKRYTSSVRCSREHVEAIFRIEQVEGCVCVRPPPGNSAFGLAEIDARCR